MRYFGFTPFLLISFALLLAACSRNVPATAQNPSAITPSDLNEVQINQTTADDTSPVNEDSNANEMGIAQKTREYILKGQSGKYAADQLKWSEAFLNQVDIDAVYQAYISGGGKADDIERFAEYLTQNAPVPENWKELFEADLSKEYGEKVSRYEALQDDLFQVYVKKEGSDVPYVVVNARTGYFHG